VGTRERKRAALVPWFVQTYNGGGRSVVEPKDIKGSKRSVANQEGKGDLVRKDLQEWSELKTGEMGREMRQE
jgi:hypothetical protein